MLKCITGVISFHELKSRSSLTLLDCVGGCQETLFEYWLQKRLSWAVSVRLTGEKMKCLLCSHSKILKLLLTVMSRMTSVIFLETGCKHKGCGIALFYLPAYARQKREKYVHSFQRKPSHNEPDTD